MVAPFVEGYVAGQSPNPCIECNRHIKFDLLFERAARLGFDAVATGHHAQVVERDGRPLPRSRRRRPEGPELRARLPARGPARHVLLPIGHLEQERGARAKPNASAFARGTSPTAKTCVSSKPSKGREVFFAQRAELTARRSSTRATRRGARRELGRGAHDGRPASRRTARRATARSASSQRVDLVARRVEVGRLEEILVDDARARRARR